MKRTPWESVLTATCLALVMVTAWAWERTVVGRRTAPWLSESWHHVSKRFPMPGEFALAPDVPAELPQVLVRADPFSPTRRPPPPATPGGSSGGESMPTDAVLFIYKGRIMLGGMPRVILEEVWSKKTHFLQLGHTVAGFKLVDMTESQVVLSNVKTNESVVIPLTSKSGSAQPGATGPPSEPSNAGTP